MNNLSGATHAPHPLFTRGDGVRFGAVALVHVLVAALYKEQAGVTIEPGPSFVWDASWHLMPLDLLYDHLFATLWNLHAQPPLYNLRCGAFVKLCYPNHVAAMQYPQIVLGALACGMVYAILRRFLGGKAWALALAFAFALNPSLFLFEASLGYDLMTAFWAVLAVFLVVMYGERRRLGWLAGFILALNLLILTRSMFHPVLLLGAIPFVCVLAGPRWRRMLAIGLCISLFSIGWCAKNEAKFGFFGTSSWAGQNLWTIVAANYDRKDLEGFADAGVIDRTVLDVLVWHRPEEYRPYGFDAISDEPALSRNNYNNINIVAISRMYGRNAVRLALYRPGHYLVNVAKAFRIYCLPTSRTKYVQDNAARMGLHEAFASQVVQGEYFTGLLRRWVGKDPFLSFWFFAIPATFLAYAVHLARYREDTRRDVALLLTAMLIAYVTLVGCTCDYGENGRFRFAIEPLLWPFTVAVWVRTLRRRA